MPGPVHDFGEDAGEQLAHANRVGHWCTLRGRHVGHDPQPRRLLGQQGGRRNPQSGASADDGGHLVVVDLRRPGPIEPRPTGQARDRHPHVAALHADTCDLGHPGSPSATVAILREQPETVDYLVLGDTTLLLEEPAGIRVVTDDRLENVASIQHGAMRRHATGSVDHDRSFAELVTEQRRHRNHPDGFWVACTDPDAAQHALTDTAPRAGLHRAAVLSDGATRLVDHFSLLNWTDFLSILAEQGPEAIITQVRAAEHSDPDGQRWPRGKRHDDASAAFCHLT